MSTTVLSTPGQQVVYTTPNGRITITLQYVRENAYTVTTMQGTLRIDANCGSYDNEQTARLVARGYAEMYRNENPAEPTTTGVRRRQVPPTMAGAHLTNPSDAGNRVLRAALNNGGTVNRSAAATVVQLKSLARKGLVTLNYASGTGLRRVVASATLTERGVKAVA
ncbi:hypothetical protein AB0K35_27720 [Micromonospora sp. NPDC053740]|uniref:hypothetical protein n=1 Tax=Micromonospora sp. NPDC053740 TaxID=3155173 RepID=UPI0034490696